MEELRRRCIGQRVSDMRQPSRHRLELVFTDGTRLLIEVRPVARIHLCSSRSKNPKKPFSFQGLLRSRLTGSLLDIHVDPSDCIVDFSFGRLRLHCRVFLGGGVWLFEEDRCLAGLEGPAEPGAVVRPPYSPRAPRFEPHDEQPSWLQAATTYFEDELREWRLHTARKQLRQDIRREQKRKRRLLSKLNEDLERTDLVATMRAQADSLGVRLHTFRQRSGTIEFPDVHDEERTWSLALKHGETAPQAMNRLYNKARRLEDAQAGIVQRIEHTESLLHAYQEALTALESAGFADLRTLRKGVALPQKTQRERRERAAWEVWTGPGGQRVRIGTDRKTNRRLVFGASKGYDVWMHLRELPSAHLVIDGSKTHPPALETLLAAAQLLLRKSRWAEGVKADVQYTQVRHLRAVPGDAGAQVIVHQEKVLLVERDDTPLKGWEKQL